MEETLKTETTVDVNQIHPAVLRRENRKYVLHLGRKAVKWTLMTAGAVAIFSKLAEKTTNQVEDEDEAV